ncbi:MAG: DUF2608 domain-containing protein [Oligoflexia bacterium]|nr:DUF2608 domain-containing protein [Oligoflexia bacterium]
MKNKTIIALMTLIFTTNIALSQTTTVQKCSVHSTEVDSKNSVTALVEMLYEIEEKIAANECNANNTLFVYDIDETVLSVNPQTQVVHGIRYSDEVIQALQNEGISTLALTARPVIVPEDALELKELAKRYFQYEQQMSAELMSKATFINSLQTRVSKLLATQYKFAYSDLRQVGIQPEQGATIFAKDLDFFLLDPNEDIDYTDESSLSQLILYSAGVILASDQAKGAVLERFLQLQKLDHHFTCIFYADDNGGHIKNMNHTFVNAPSIQLHSYHLPTAALQ